MRFPHKMKLLMFLFFTILVLLIGQVIGNTKDINDGWILEGIFPLFLLFTLTYAMIVGFSSNTKLIAILTSIYLVIVVLIPNLKYSFIYGYHDPMAHYGFIRDTISLGHVPDAGFYASEYGSTPGSHILVSTLSIVTGMDVVGSMKVFLVMSPSILPLVAYFVLRKLRIQTQLFKLIIIATAITFPAQYTFSGTSGIYPIFVLFIYFWLLFCSGKSNERSNFAIATLLGVTVIISHDVTSTFVLFCLVLALVFYFFTKTGKFPTTYSSTTVFFSILIILLIFAHFIFASNSNFPRLLSLIRNSIVSLFTSASPVAFEYYQGFFELSLLQKLGVLAVRFAKNAILIFLSILAPLAIWRLKLSDDNLKRFYRNLAIPIFIALSSFILPLFIRPLVSRGLFYLSAFSPFLVGITIFWFVYSKRYRFENTILTVVVFSLISISIIQIYPCQPLIPRVSTEYGDYYVADWRQVTTIYTRSMVYFVATYNLRLNIWVDTITRWEIYGLTNATFQSLLTWHSSSAPLILISRAGVAHIIASARTAVAYEQYLRNALQESSIIYTNGESCIFFNATSARAPLARVAQ